MTIFHLPSAPVFPCFTIYGLLPSHLVHLLRSTLTALVSLFGLFPVLLLSLNLHHLFLCHHSDLLHLFSPLPYRLSVVALTCLLNLASVCPSWMMDPSSSWSSSDSRVKGQMVQLLLTRIFYFDSDNDCILRLVKIVKEIKLTWLQREGIKWREAYVCFIIYRWCWMFLLRAF